MNLNRNTKGEGILLSQKHNLYLERFYELEKEKKYITIFRIVVYKEEKIIPLTNNFSETIQFKEELHLFAKGDEQNQFLNLVSRKLNKKEVQSLELKKNIDVKIYFSLAESKTVATLIYYFMQGFSLSKVYDQDLNDLYSLYLIDI